MTTESDLDHLLDRARHGVLLPAEGEVLADQVQQMRDTRERYGRALDRAHALADELDGHGPIDRAETARLLREVMDVRPGVWQQTPALTRALRLTVAAAAPSAPLDAAVAASGPLAGPERHPGGPTGRQTGAEGVGLTAATLHPVSTAPSTPVSGPQGASRGPDGDREGGGPHGAADGRTAARDGGAA